MRYLKLFVSSFFVFSLFSLIGCSSGLQFQNIKHIHLLQDTINNIDGLDNPRVAKFNQNDSQLFVVSADDDALAIFNVGNNVTLSLSQVFKNNQEIKGLRGATDVAISKNGQYAYVVSFYDSALVIFKKADDGKFHYQHTYTDKIKWWEYKGKPISSALQKFYLLGAYDIEINSSGNQMYIASSVSNAVSIFNINEDGFPIFSHAIKDTDNINFGLKGAVDVALTPDDNHFAVAGFNENVINYFKREVDNTFRLEQSLVNNSNGINNLDKPQSVVFSNNGEYLYVACASGAIVVFNQDHQGKLSYLESIKSEQITGLDGAGSVLMSNDDRLLYVVAENDNALSIFYRNVDGTLTLKDTINNLDFNENNLLGASSVTLSTDGQYLIVTAGKGDSLNVFEVN